MENQSPTKPNPLPPELSRALREVTDVTSRMVSVQLSHEREWRLLLRHWLVLIALAGLLLGGTVYLLAHVTTKLRRLEERCPGSSQPA